MSTITSMQRNTAQTYRVKLECGHQIVISKDELNRNQWFIGRRVKCPECG